MEECAPRRVRVSIVIPCFNGRRYLEECLRSVAELVEPSDEVVLVDDGSTETIRDIVEQFSPLVRYVWRANGGIGAARNTGIRESTGRYVRFLDADDYLLPTGAMAAQVQLLDAQPEVGLVYAQAMRVDEAGRPFGFRKPAFARGSYVRSGDEELADLIMGNYILPSTTIVRRAVLDRIGGFRTDLRTTEDWEMWLRIARASSIGYVAEPVVAYRSHRESVSASYRLGSWWQIHTEIIDGVLNDAPFAERYAARGRAARARLYARAIIVATRSGQTGAIWRATRDALRYGLEQHQWRLVGRCLWLLARGLVPAGVLRRWHRFKRRAQVARMARKSAFG
jgi:glycosyltransferase involved in cell wall biosynthesis